MMNARNFVNQTDQTTRSGGVSLKTLMYSLGALGHKKEGEHATWKSAVSMHMCIALITFLNGIYIHL